MALVVWGTTCCGLCDMVLQKWEGTIGFPAFSTLGYPEWSRLSDGAVHRRCFEKWAARDEFLSRFPAISTKRA